MFHSKRLRLDNGCNLNSMLNNGLQNGTKWSFSGDTSFVEPEILEDMGVSMLEDAVVNIESTRQPMQSQERVISPVSSNGNKRLLNEINSIVCHEEIHTSSNSDIVNIERFVLKKSHF